jgi:hypothetical protein
MATKPSTPTRSSPLTHRVGNIMGRGLGFPLHTTVVDGDWEVWGGGVGVGGVEGRGIEGDGTGRDGTWGLPG